MINYVDEIACRDWFVGSQLKGYVSNAGLK